MRRAKVRGFLIVTATLLLAGGRLWAQGAANPSGTGRNPWDVTPEAVRQVLDRATGGEAFAGFDVVVAFDRREVEVEEAESLPDPVVAAPGAAPGDFAAASRGRRLERLVMRLPAAQRMAVTLYYYEDRSVEQAAAILEMPVNTVKTHLARARAALRAAWQKEGL